ncbi:MAG: PhoH family protein [Pseudomonadota bacterium]|jgi:phosphate starvation-inducible PhoH-like protein
MAKRKRPVNQELESFHEMPRRFKLNGSQERACRAIREHPVSVLLGNAGCGKSFAALYMAREMLQSRQIERIAIVRSPLEISRAQIGFLGGDLSQKLEPWAAASRCIGKELGIEDALEFVYLGHIQGMTFTDTMVIVEECQSLTLAEFEAVVTRLGLGSYMVFTGDPLQDIKRSGGLLPFVHAVRHVEGVAIVQFDPKDNQRHPIIRNICNALWGDQPDLSNI